MQMEVTMRKLIVIIALGVAVLFGMAKTPSLATETDYASKLPEAVQTLEPGLQLVGYQHGGQYCQYRRCGSYYNCGYYRKCCSYYEYYDCAPYGGGGGYYKKRYYNGGGGGY
jgi:hypothetical protein